MNVVKYFFGFAAGSIFGLAIGIYATVRVLHWLWRKDKAHD